MQAHGELLLALPFENTGGSPSVDWIGAAFPEILNQRFSAAGFLPISRDDRAYALDHLGLPPDFRPTRASTLRLAQALDADSVIFGTYQVEADATGTRITATARVLDIANLRESAPITESAELSRLPDVVNALAWRITRQLDPTYAVAEQTFLAADANLRLDAFEAYVRGLVQGSAEDRVRHLRDAVRLDPNYGPAWLALGDASFAAQNYDQAAVAYGHLSRNDPNALQADFHRGLAFFYTGKYLPAEDAFAFVSTRLPLPEVVNNQGVAAARRGKDGAPLFQQAITGDPKDADYHFNLALAYARRGDAPDAQKETAEALKLRPNDSELQAFASNLHNPGFLHAPDAGAGPGTQTPGPVNLPLERVKRSYDEAAFRQAAFEMEQMETLRAATEPPAKRLAALLADANRYGNAGLLVESEREYNRALAVDPNSAEAYAGLARIRERTADRDAAKQLANRSVQLHDNPAAHLVLARLALLANQVPLAATEVEAALRLDGNNAEARGLRQAVAARGGQVP
jgi:tetratricopeptide (TPR) repeat protein